jgi:hypothetical protein
MAGTLSAGVNSLILKLDQPYDTIRTTDIRDDLIKVKVWCSATPNFTPVDTLNALGVANANPNQVFDGLSLSIVITQLANLTSLVAGTPYYVKYAFISDIEEAVFTISSQLTATPVAATSQIVDISGFTSFVKSDETTFTPTNVTLTAVIAGITNPIYAWTITGATPTTGTGSSITITPNPTNGTGVGVTLSVTGTGLTTPIVKTITIPITYVPPTYYISNYGAVFRRDLDGVVYPAAGIVLDSGYSKFRSSPQPTFVWKKDNVTIIGATSYSYTVPASDYADSTSHVYTSIATGLDLGGNSTSITASVQIPRVDDGPIGPATPSFTISNYGAVFRRDIEGTVYPSAGIRLETTTAAFKSTPTVTYQWKKDDVIISGATSNSYTVPVADYATVATHNYSCTATGQSITGIATVLTASVTLPRVDDGPIGPATPSFTISNYGAVFRKDNTNTLYPTTGILLQTTTLGFKSSPTVTYQWKKNGTNISGATSDSYTVPVGDYATVSTNNYSCTATGQTTAGVATVLTATVTLPVITDGTVGSTGSRTATGYIYYQTAVATAPLTPSASNYDFSTGQFDTLTAGWDYSPISPSTADTTLKAWVSRYSVVEPTYDTATGAATITAPSASINFNGIVTFSNYSSGATPLATAASVTSKLSAADLGSSGTTVIDGGRITTGTIAAGRLDLSGVLTATSVGNTGTTTIDGGRIGTGTITANRLDLSGVLKVGSTNADGSVNTTTTINGGSIQTGSISANRLDTSYIQVGTAATDINNGVTGISAGKITTGTIDAARLNLSGYLLVGNAANDINNGTTGINGGKITTGTIDAARINLTSYLQVGGAAGDINSGTTGISGGKITTGTIDAARLNLTGYLQVGGAAGDINGNSTTINGGKITTGSIDAIRLTIGNTSAADRIRLFDNKIEIWASGVRRVVLGDLS